MPINDLLLPELDAELKKTRTTLERVPPTSLISSLTPSPCLWENLRLMWPNSPASA